MLDSSAAAQHEVAPEGQVLNVSRPTDNAGEIVESYTPRSLPEHEHTTLQVSALLRDTLANVGWQTATGSATGRRMRGGQTYVVASGQPHDFRLLRPRGMVNFHLGWESLVALHPASFERRPRLLDELIVLDDPLLARLAHQVHTVCRGLGELRQLYLDAAWNLLAAHLARRLVHPVEAPIDRSPRLNERRLRRVLDQVEAHALSGGLRVSDLAATAGYSPVHFTRLFTASVGVTPLQYVIRRRLEHARSLLASTDLPIAAIAHGAGFSSHARFTESFRRQFGRTPQGFRKGGENR